MPKSTLDERISHLVVFFICCNSSATWLTVLVHLLVGYHFRNVGCEKQQDTTKKRRENKRLSGESGERQGFRKMPRAWSAERRAGRSVAAEALSPVFVLQAAMVGEVTGAMRV